MTGTDRSGSGPPSGGEDAASGEDGTATGEDGTATEGTASGEGPLVTAVVTTYDRPEQAKRAIRSVLAQTYDPLEVLVVEDGTDTGIEQWLRDEGLDEAVEFHRHATNRGLAAARNTGLELADGEYVAYLDDDDAWKPERVERQVQLAASLPASERERVGVVYCALESREDGAVASVIRPENRGPLRNAIVSDGASTVQSSFLFPVEALESVGGFDESLPSSIDHDVWMALADAGYEARAIDEPLVVSYDDFADSMMTDTGSRIEGVGQFVDKWRGPYAEWTSPEQSERWAQRYFARVVARLAAAKVVTGDWGEARRAAGAIFDESDHAGYNVFVLSRQLLEASAKRFLPAWAVRVLSAARNRFSAPAD